MSVTRVDGTNTPRSIRLANWDLLRSLSMFLVIVVHCGAYPCVIGSVNLGGALGRAAIVCDPVFFVLSGYFAIRPLRGSLRSYYQRKLVTIVLPLLVYSVVLYVWTTRLGGMSLGGWLGFTVGMMGSWWFIPCLIPFLVLAPFLYVFFEGLNDKWLMRLSGMVLAVSVWSCLVNFLGWALPVFERPGLAALVDLVSRLIPTHLVPTGYFVFFCAGYFLRRVSALLSRSAKKALVVLGLVFLGLDTLANYYGVPVCDPSDYWFAAVAATFIVFDSIRISSSSTLGRVLRWTGKRSYSIYLLQSTVIGMFGTAIYGENMLGDIAGVAWHVRLLVWLMFIIVSYVVSLALASVFDSLVLGPVQRACERGLKWVDGHASARLQK